MKKYLILNPIKLFKILMNKNISIVEKLKSFIFIFLILLLYLGSEAQRNTPEAIEKRRLSAIEWENGREERERKQAVEQAVSIYRSYFKKQTIFETSTSRGTAYGCGGGNTYGKPYFFIIDTTSLAFQAFGGKDKKGQPCLVKYSMNDGIFTIKGSVDCRFSDCYDNWIGDYVFIKPYEWSDGSLHEEGMWVNQNNENFLIKKSVYSSMDYVFTSFHNKTWGIK